MKAYEKLMTENNLKLSDLPQDAQTGIKALKVVENVQLTQEKKAEKNGTVYKPSADIANKIKAYDKWVAAEIIDYLEDKDTNTAKPNVDANEIIADIKKDGDKKIVDDKKPATVDNKPVDDNVQKTHDPKGVACDKEFDAMIKKGITECTLDDLKSHAPTVYDIIFESYEKGGENGIATTNFSLKEVGDKFVLTKK